MVTKFGKKVLICHTQITFISNFKNHTQRSGNSVIWHSVLSRVFKSYQFKVASVIMYL